MIDPQNITRYDRSPEELLEFFLFAVLVAGKKAEQQAACLARLAGRLGGETLREGLTRAAILNTLPGHLRAARTGKYKVLEACIRQLLVEPPPFLAWASVPELMALPGVGPKTARLFVLHSRPDARVAVLDVHILAWLRSQGVRAPRQTPASPQRYAELEARVLAEADRRLVPPAALDLFLWSQRRAA